MQIAFHIGANCTDEDRLLKSLLKNGDTFRKHGIAVPGPGRYRSLIRETIQGLGGIPPHADTRDILLDAIVESGDIHRVLLSNENFICIPNRVFENATFYEQATSKTHGLHQLFPDDDIELFIGIRNPATFAQETFRKSKSATIQEHLGLLSLRDLHWSKVIGRIKAGAPDTPITVWCNEDAPLLFEQLIRAMSNIAPDVTVDGGLDMLAPLIGNDGIKAIEAELSKNPPTSHAERHEVIAKVWEQHVITDKVEDVIEISGLTNDQIADATQAYDDDLARIAAISGVKLLLPFT